MMCFHVVGIASKSQYSKISITLLCFICTT